MFSNSPGPTKPVPFSFERREAIRPKRIATRRLEADLMAKAAAEASEALALTLPHEVPKSTEPGKFDDLVRSWASKGGNSFGRWLSSAGKARAARRDIERIKQGHSPESPQLFRSRPIPEAIRAPVSEQIAASEAERASRIRERAVALAASTSVPFRRLLGVAPLDAPPRSSLPPSRPPTAASRPPPSSPNGRIRSASANGRLNLNFNNGTSQGGGGVTIHHGATSPKVPHYSAATVSSNSQRVSASARPNHSSGGELVTYTPTRRPQTASSSGAAARGGASGVGSASFGNPHANGSGGTPNGSGRVGRPCSRPPPIPQASTAQSTAASWTAGRPPDVAVTQGASRYSARASPSARKPTYHALPSTPGQRAVGDGTVASGGAATHRPSTEYGQLSSSYSNRNPTSRSRGQNGTSHNGNGASFRTPQRASSLKRSHSVQYPARAALRERHERESVEVEMRRRATFAPHVNRQVPDFEVQWAKFQDAVAKARPLPLPTEPREFHAGRPRMSPRARQAAALARMEADQESTAVTQAGRASSLAAQAQLAKKISHLRRALGAGARVGTSIHTHGGDDDAWMYATGGSAGGVAVGGAVVRDGNRLMGASRLRGVVRTARRERVGPRSRRPGSSPSQPPVRQVSVMLDNAKVAVAMTRTANLREAVALKARIAADAAEEAAEAAARVIQLSPERDGLSLQAMLALKRHEIAAAVRDGRQKAKEDESKYLNELGAARARVASSDPIWHRTAAAVAAQKAADKLKEEAAGAAAARRKAGLDVAARRIRAERLTGGGGDADDGGGGGGGGVAAGVGAGAVHRRPPSTSSGHPLSQPHASKPPPLVRRPSLEVTDGVEHTHPTVVGRATVAPTATVMSSASVAIAPTTAAPTATALSGTFAPTATGTTAYTAGTATTAPTAHAATTLPNASAHAAAHASAHGAAHGAVHASVPTTAPTAAPTAAAARMDAALHTSRTSLEDSAVSPGRVDVGADDITTPGTMLSPSGTAADLQSPAGGDDDEDIPYPPSDAD